MKANPENYLALWLDRRLSDDQLKEIVSEKEFQEYLVLRESLTDLQIAPPDMDSNLKQTKEKMRLGLRPKARRVIPLYGLSAIAACVVVGIFLFQLLTFGPEIKTGSGQHTSIALPDGSEVQLNSASSISRTSLFTLNRKIKLTGEAFFDVSKGRSFVVTTALGEVEVLGTAFNIIARDHYFEVICYEGLVRVSTTRQIVKLSKGQAIRVSRFGTDRWETSRPQPGWLVGEAHFEQSPLGLVLEQLATEYAYSIDCPEAFKSIRTTGTFTRSNLDTALRTVLVPMGLRYEIDGKTIVVRP